MAEQVFVDKAGLTLYNSLVKGDTTPQMDGTGATGVSKKFARADHVHPSDTSKVDKETGKGLSSNDYTTAEKNKLSGLPDSAIPTSEKGQASGVATLDSGGKIPSSQLPSYVDDVVEGYPVSGVTELTSGWLSYDSAGTDIITPESGKIYVLIAASTTHNVNSQFRWSGTQYSKLNDGGGVRAITIAEIEAIVNS